MPRPGGPPARPALVAAAAALALAAGAGLLLADPALAHDPPRVQIEIQAHDNTATGDYWFTSNKTGGTQNPTLDFPRGAIVNITFVNPADGGTANHNLHLGGPVDASTETIGTGQSRQLDVQIPWDATSFAYWCDPHRGLGMEGDVDPGDGGNSAPDLSVTSPGAGAEVEGEVLLEGDALDDDADPVTVEVQLPGSDEWQEATGSTSWELAWDTTEVADGDHAVSVRATDRHDANATVDRTFTVVNDRNQDPTLSVGSPPAGAQVQAGEVTLEGTASDADGNLDRVEVQAPPDGDTWQPAEGTAEWSFTWNASEAGTGNHTLRVRAVDADGASVAVDHTLEVVEETANRAPQLTLSHPEDGATVEDETRVAGNATDPDGDPVTVEVRVPTSGDWQQADGPDASGAWSFPWDASSLEAGSYTISVRAGDGEARSTEEVTVRVPGDGNRPPTVAFASPARDETVSPPVTVVVTAGDIDEGDSVERVRVRFASQEGFQEAEPAGGDRWQAEVPGVGVPPGPANLTAVASDGDLTSRAVLPVRIPGTEAAPSAGPVVNVTVPPPDRVEGLVTVRGVVEDEEVQAPPLRVEMRFGGEVVDVLETSPGPFQLSWNAHGEEPGVRDLVVQAFDGPTSSEPVAFAVRVGPAAEAADAGAGVAAPGAGLASLVLAGVAAAAAGRRRG